MARDDLNDPLGMRLIRDDAPARTLPYRTIVISGCGVLALGLVAFALVPGEGPGGEPYATAAIVAAKKA